MSIIPSIVYTNTYVEGTRTYATVLIELKDAATGQLTNGNNIVINTDFIINGSTYPQSFTIPGQSYQIYQGAIRDTDPFNSWLADFKIVDIGTASNPAPPVNQCDLAINFITVDKTESAPGAGDGQFTINALSSYGPVQYSNDFGSTFQSSPTFGSLTGGLYQPVVKDANPLGCTVQGTVTIPVLNNLLISDPSVDLGNGNISRWNAAFNPVVFTYQRKDYEVTGAQLDTATGKTKLSVNASLVNFNTNKGVSVNDMVYLFTGSYKGVFKVLRVDGASWLIIDTPYLGNATGYININSLRPYYRILTQITYQDKLTGQQNTITSTNRPDTTGLVKADISNFLQSLLRAKDQSDFTGINFRDDNLSASYQVQYAEGWDDGSANGYVSGYATITDPYYVLYAAKQLGERYGGNLAAYVPFTLVNDTSKLAKWVTDFNEPAYSNGYPFDIGFIYSEYLTGQDMFCETTLLDINRNPLQGGSSATYLLNEDGSWLLNQDGSKMIIAGQGATPTAVPAQLGLNRLLIANIFPSNAYYFKIALKYIDGDGATHTVTQSQTVRIDDAVDERSVYLRWIGLSGSWNYYRFVYNQEVSLDVQNATIIKNYVSDWEGQDGIEEVIEKDAGQKMKVMAEDLSVNDIKGLQSIKYSPKAQMLINKSPVKWQTIVINTATYSEYETAYGQAQFSITFNMPSINIQSQ